MLNYILAWLIGTVGGIAVGLAMLMLVEWVSKDKDNYHG